MDIYAHKVTSIVINDAIFEATVDTDRFVRKSIVVKTDKDDIIMHLFSKDIIIPIIKYNKNIYSCMHCYKIHENV